MQGVVIVAAHRLWVPTFALARMLLEDTAVAYWLVNHPDVEALRTRWSEHLAATRFGDVRAQQELGLEVDADTTAWLRDQDHEYLDKAATRHRCGADHWSGKTITELAAGAAGRGGSTRDHWNDRTTSLQATCKRMHLIVKLGLHHSSAASQHWYADSRELLADPLRGAWVAFWLRLMVALEEFAPEHSDALDELLTRQRDLFTVES
jgi:hypothetical protein